MSYSSFKSMDQVLKDLELTLQPSRLFSEK